MTLVKHLTIPQAARSVGVSADLVRIWIDAGLIETAKLPSIGKGKKKHVRIRADEWERFVKSWSSKPEPCSDADS